MNVKQIVLVLISACAIPCQAQMRTWTDKASQREVHAEFVELNEGVVVVRREDGTLAKVPLERLSQADQEYVSSQNTPIDASPRGSQQSAAFAPEPELPKSQSVGNVADQAVPRPSTVDKSLPMDPKIAVISVLCVLMLAIIVALACRRRAFVYRVPADVFLGCLVGILLAAALELRDKTDDFFPAAWELATDKRTWDVLAAYHAIENIDWNSRDEVLRALQVPLVLSTVFGAAVLLGSIATRLLQCFRGRPQSTLSQGNSSARDAITDFENQVLQRYTQILVEYVGIDPQLVKTGSIQPVVLETYPFEEIVDAESVRLIAARCELAMPDAMNLLKGGWHQDEAREFARGLEKGVAYQEQWNLASPEKLTVRSAVRAGSCLYRIDELVKESDGNPRLRDIARTLNRWRTDEECLGEGSYAIRRLDYLLKFAPVGAPRSLSEQIAVTAALEAAEGVENSWSERLRAFAADLNVPEAFVSGQRLTDEVLLSLYRALHVQLEQSHKWSEATELTDGIGNIHFHRAWRQWQAAAESPPVSPSAKARVCSHLDEAVTECPGFRETIERFKSLHGITIPDTIRALVE